MEQLAPNTSTRFGVFELDKSSGELRKSGTRVRLQDQPLKILLALLEQPGAVVARDELKRRIWPNDSFGDFDHAVNVAVAKLRAALGDSADTPRYVETMPRRGYRFIYPVANPAANPVAPEFEKARENGAALLPAALTETKPRIRWRPVVAAGVIGAVLAVSAWWLLNLRKSKKMLTDKDTVVLADFENSTGDPVFDGTIRQGLAVQLEQSPFLKLVSEATVKQTLRLMGRLPDARLTPEIAQQLCLRTGSAAVLDGSIAKLGNQYVLGLRAIDCRTGDSLAEEQATAATKEDVLKAVAQTASRLRSRLGESVRTVQKYNASLDQVTTSSLEALHAYSLGRTTLIDREDPAGGIQLFQRAIALDPNFAMAYASLGLAYGNYSEEESIKNYTRAYELRDRVSDRERFYIESHYHASVTGDWEKARHVYELWIQLYPRDDIPHLNLSEVLSSMGEYEDAKTEAGVSLRLLPGDCISYGAVVGLLIRLNRPAEAQAQLSGSGSPVGDCLHLEEYRYALAFLQNDKSEMAQIAAAAQDNWDSEFSSYLAQTAAYSGRLRESRGLMRRVVSSARQAEQVELGGMLQELGAESEALIGDPELAKQQARDALARSRGRDVEGVGAVALALARDEAGAQSVADDLARRFPDSTLVQTNYLPSVKAQLALNHRDTAKALEYLQVSAPYEMGNADGSNPLFPVYLRGQTYLMAGEGGEAAVEFQKILDHPGIVLFSPIGALAKLQIARAFQLQGQSVKARAAYQNFLSLWKDADPDIRILKQAQAEYAKLH